MKITVGISKQLITAMGIVSLIIAGSSFIISYLLYVLAIEFQLISFEELNNSGFTPNFIDLIWLTSVLLIGVIISLYMGFKLSQRFIIPINSLARAAKLITQGDLSARAKINADTALTEISYLVEDFNGMAEQLEHSVAEVSIWNAAIAHELRTPVTILQGRLQGIIDGVFEPDTLLIEELLRQVQGLSRIIEDLRTLSLANNQQLRLNCMHVPFDENIQRCLAMFQNRLDTAGLTPVLQLSNTYCYCDPQRLEQVCMALLDNAVRYAKPGCIYLSTIMHEHNWIFRIEDEGPGIAPEHLPYLFNPFYRLEESRNKAQGGSGLGLSVIKAIAVAHAGQATYTLSSRGGSCFSIELPQPFHHTIF